jgi:hypothetical protein
MKKQREELKCVVEFDEFGLPRLPDDGNYPEWVIYAIEEWRTSLVVQRKKHGLNVPI